MTEKIHHFTREPQVQKAIGELLEKTLEEHARGEVEGVTIVVTYKGKDGCAIRSSYENRLRHVGGLVYSLFEEMETRSRRG